MLLIAGWAVAFASAARDLKLRMIGNRIAAATAIAAPRFLLSL